MPPVTDMAEVIERAIEDRATLLAILEQAENALADYIPRIEATGAHLNYGHMVLANIRAALKARNTRTQEVGE